MLKISAGRAATRSIRRTVLSVAAMSVMVVASVLPAHAGITQHWDTFDPARPGWWTVGGAGFDYGKNYAYTGTGNGWVRGTRGWNAINTSVGVYPWATCTVSAWVRVSPNLTDGYMSVLTDDFTIINEVRLSGAGTPGAGYRYNQYSFQFNPRGAWSVRFHFGMWGNGQDAWATIDELVVECPTPY